VRFEASLGVVDIKSKGFYHIQRIQMIIINRDANDQSFDLPKITTKTVD
jgi:hypothetical protein